MVLGMELPTRNETPETPQKETQDVVETRPETQEVVEAAKRVEQVTFEPEAVVELEINYKEAEALETSFVKTVEGSVLPLDTRPSEADPAIENKAIETGEKGEETGDQAAIMVEKIISATDRVAAAQVSVEDETIYQEADGLEVTRDKAVEGSILSPDTRLSEPGSTRIIPEVKAVEDKEAETGEKVEETGDQGAIMIDKILSPADRPEVSRPLDVSEVGDLEKPGEGKPDLAAPDPETVDRSAIVQPVPVMPEDSGDTSVQTPDGLHSAPVTTVEQEIDPASLGEKLPTVPSEVAETADDAAARAERLAEEAAAAAKAADEARAAAREALEEYRSDYQKYCYGDSTNYFDKALGGKEFDELETWVQESLTFEYNRAVEMDAEADAKEAEADEAQKAANDAAATAKFLADVAATVFAMAGDVGGDATASETSEVDDDAEGVEPEVTEAADNGLTDQLEDSESIEEQTEESGSDGASQVGDEELPSSETGEAEPVEEVEEVVPADQAEGAVEGEESDSDDQSEEEPDYTYTVSSTGESLQSIADQFGVSVEDLIAANPDIQDTGMGLDLGTELVIPIESTDVGDDGSDADEPVELVEGEDYWIYSVSRAEYVGGQVETPQYIARVNGVPLAVLLWANPNSGFSLAEEIIIPQGEYLAELEVLVEAYFADHPDDAAAYEAQWHPDDPVQGVDYDYVGCYGDSFSPQTFADSWGISLEALTLLNPELATATENFQGELKVPSGAYIEVLEAQVAAMQAESGETDGQPTEESDSGTQTETEEEGSDPAGEFDEVVPADQVQDADPVAPPEEGTEPGDQPATMVEEPPSEDEAESDEGESDELVEGVDYETYEPRQPGETLEMIAEQYDVSVDALMLANPDIANGTVAFGPGTIIVIPLQGEYLAELEAQAAAMQEEPVAMQEYVRITVPEGSSSTLEQLSAEMNISLQALLDANPGLNWWEVPEPGDYLLIPRDAPAAGEAEEIDPGYLDELVRGVDYDLVQPSGMETLETIADGLGISIEALMLANPHITNENGRFAPGTVIVIPLQGEYLAELEAQAAAMQEEPVATMQEYVRITVPEGSSSTLEQLSAEMNISLQALLDANPGLNWWEVPEPGGYLLIPRDAPAAGEAEEIDPGYLDELVRGVDYDLVQPSGMETLETIADGLGISIEALMLANPHITNENGRFAPGTVIVIPLQGEYLAELEAQAAAMQAESGETDGQPVEESDSGTQTATEEEGSDPVGESDDVTPDDQVQDTDLAGQPVEGTEPVDQTGTMVEEPPSEDGAESDEGESDELVLGVDYVTFRVTNESMHWIADQYGISLEVLALANPDIPVGYETYNAGLDLVIPIGEYAAELEAQATGNSESAG